MMQRVFPAVATILLICLAPPLPAQESARRGDYQGARESEHPAWFKQSFLDLEEDIADAAAQDRRLALYFWQPGCPYCAELIESNFGQHDVSETMRSRFEVVAINMWGDREVVQVGGKHFTEKTLAAALRVNYTPTLMFFDERGGVALRLDGYIPPEQFRVAMDYASGMHDPGLSYREFVAMKAPAPAAGVLHDEAFFRDPPFDLAAAVAAGDGPFAVYFEQKQCDQCDNLHGKVLKNPPTRELAERFHSIQLDMWSDVPVTTPAGESTTAREWAAAMGLAYAPSIVFFDRAGEEVMRIEGLLRTFHVQSVFDYVLSSAYVEQPSFQRYISARADRLREEGIDVDIWSY